eukprot:182184-Chlamydomonas_euryale.AAC.1
MKACHRMAGCKRSVQPRGLSSDRPFPHAYGRACGTGLPSSQDVVSGERAAVGGTERVEWGGGLFL